MRAEFRSIPVNRSILNSIEAIGVGLRPMQAKSRYMKSIRVTKRKLRNGELLDEKEENNILKNRNMDYKNSISSAQIPNSPHHSWMPLFPFGNILPTHLSNKIGETKNIAVKKLPIKVLGSAGRHDELPRSTKGLPEIVS